MEYDLPNREDPLVALVRQIEGTEEVIEITRNGTTVAVLIDAGFYAALRGEAEGQAY